VFDVPYLTGKTLDITTYGWKFWLQTFAGNWSPESFPPFLEASGNATKPGSISQDDKDLFSISAGIAIWLNNLIIIALALSLWKATIDRRSAMKLGAAFGQRDVIIGTNIIEAIVQLPDKSVSNIRTTVIRSISDGDNEWENITLNDIYGPEKAERIRVKLRELREITLE